MTTALLDRLTHRCHILENAMLLARFCDLLALSSSEMRELNLVTVGTPPATIDQAAPIASLGNQGPEEAAIDLVRSLVEGDPSLDVVAQLYAPQVSYYGKLKLLSKVLTDKLAYSNRWPERHYKIRPETVLATCANGHCMVSGAYNWVVRSLNRNKQAKGAARFSYTISASGDPKIVAVAGEVVRD